MENMLPRNAVNVIWPGILCFVSLDTTERLIAYIKHLAHSYIQNSNPWQYAALAMTTLAALPCMAIPLWSNP